MDEQFILRVPPSVAERIEQLLNENPSSSVDGSLDLSFSEDGRSGTFVIGNDRFPASLLDLPCIVESYKTYDDNVLIKTGDIGQDWVKGHLSQPGLTTACSQGAKMLPEILNAKRDIITVREEGDPAPEGVEYRHGLTPPMRDARRRRFRREPDLNPELVQRVEKDLLNIMAGGTVENVDVEVVEHGEEGDDNARNAQEKTATMPPQKPEAPEAVMNGGEPDRSDSDDSDDSI